MTLFKVNFGYDWLGRERNRYYQTLREAAAVASLYYRRTGIVLSIIEVQRGTA
jgi:hypothetical protein